MKKIILIFSILFVSLFQSTFASSWHFVTKDGQHMCGDFLIGKQKFPYVPCESIGIIYDNIGNVIKGDIPIDIVNLGILVTTRMDTTSTQTRIFCVRHGKEAENISSCDETSYNASTGEKCIIKDGLEKCIIENGNNPVLSGTMATYGNATCTINGQSVDCTKAAEQVGGWIKIGLWGFLIFGILCLVGGIFWIILLIHAISNPIPNKILWVLVIFFLSPVGMIIYYFVIKRKYISVMVPNSNNPPYQMNVGMTYSEGPVVATQPPIQNQVAPAPQATTFIVE